MKPKGQGKSSVLESRLRSSRFSSLAGVSNERMLTDIPLATTFVDTPSVAIAKSLACWLASLTFPSTGTCFEGFHSTWATHERGNPRIDSTLARMMQRGALPKTGARTEANLGPKVGVRAAINEVSVGGRWAKRWSFVTRRLFGERATRELAVWVPTGLVTVRRSVEGRKVVVA